MEFLTKFQKDDRDGSFVCRKYEKFLTSSWKYWSAIEIVKLMLFLLIKSNEIRDIEIADFFWSHKKEEKS